MWVREPSGACLGVAEVSEPLNFREGPGLGWLVLRVLQAGARVHVWDALPATQPPGQWLTVQPVAETVTGFCHSSGLARVKVEG
jgi:hypothetical protein